MRLLENYSAKIEIVTSVKIPHRILHYYIYAEKVRRDFPLVKGGTHKGINPMWCLREGTSCKVSYLQNS